MAVRSFLRRAETAEQLGLGGPGDLSPSGPCGPCGPGRSSGRGQGLSLEGTGGRAQPVLHRAGRVIQARRPLVTPEPDVSVTVVGGVQDQPANPLVLAVQIRPQRDDLQTWHLHHACQ